MPRPKRIKVAPSVTPAPRVRKRPKASPAVEAHAAAAAETEEVNNSYHISDLDEGVVMSARRVRKNNSQGKALEIGRETRMAGSIVDALEIGDTLAPTMSRPIAGIPSEESLLGNLDLESSSPSVEVGRRDRSTTGVESSMLAIANFRRRPRQNSILGRAAARARSSSVESNLAEDNGLMSVGRKNNLGNGNHQSHQREPNVMGRNAGRVRSSSIGLEMDRGTPAIRSAMKVGNFKRRAREPSVLGTAQKKQQRKAPYEDDDEDDFNPDDESTPLNLSRTRPMNASPSSNSRKRRLLAVLVPQSQPSHSSSPIPPDEDIENPGTVLASSRPNGGEAEEEEDNEAERGVTRSSPSQELPIPSIEGRSITPEPFSETMAPPRSSSSSPRSSFVAPAVEILQFQRAPSRGRRPLRNQTPLVFSHDSPPSSPPSLTHSPNRPARASARPNARRQPPPASTLSTAQLQALLPRRRQRARDAFDITSSEDEVDVSGLASDDDELAHSTIRAPPRRGAPAPRPKPKAVTKAKAGAKITYGSKRQATSDKENEDDIDPDDSLAPIPDDDEASNAETSQELEMRVGKELKRAAKKFAEVDKWEMEFEDMTASSSSPKDAR